MRGYIPNYQLVTPNSLGEVLSLLATEPRKWKPFAGGTDLMVLLEAGKLSHRDYVNLLPLQELRQIEVDKTHVTLGALTTYTDVQRHSVLADEFPMLCQAASETGGLAIQNRGTLGGNIMNASPAADSPPALLAYDADLELSSTEGTRWIPYSSFHTGYKQMAIRDDELLTRIRLPRSSMPFFHYYRKVGTRKAQAISKVCFAAVLRLDGQQIENVRIAVGSVAPIPLRCRDTEVVLGGQILKDELVRIAQQKFVVEITPIDDIRSTKHY